MDLETIVQLFLILGALSGFGSLYLHYRLYKQQTPNLECYFQCGFYTVDVLESKELVTVEASFMVKNPSFSSTSISHGSCYIKLLSSAFSILSYNAVKGNANHELLPLDIKANGTTKIDMVYTFETAEREFFDRCMIPTNLKNPKRENLEDLPIAVLFGFRHTYGQFDTKACIYRKDQPGCKKPTGERGGLCYSLCELENKDPKLVIME